MRMEAMYLKTLHPKGIRICWVLKPGHPSAPADSDFVMEDRPVEREGVPAPVPFVLLLCCH